MPPWQSMTPQQQQMLLQMMMSRGTNGMQFSQLPGMMAQPGAAQFGANPALGANVLTGGMGAQNNLMQNPTLMQYLMGLNGGGAGTATPSLAQLLQMRGGGLGL